MTRQEAAAILKERFPGKKFYVDCTCWDGGSPTFSATVYEVDGTDPDSNRNARARTLENAVNQILAMRPPGDIQAEADAFFSSKPDAAPVEAMATAEF